MEDNQPSRQLALLEPGTTAGQPAPVSTKVSWNPRPLQGNRPPCLQKFLDLSTEGNRPSSLEQDSLPETAQGNQPPCVF